MSGMKRAMEDKDPDYDEISVAQPSKRHKPNERTARDAAVQKIEGIITEQFADEMKNKEHEIEVINQRLLDARRMMDKLRACIVANYYASAGLPKAQEAPRLCEQMVFNHPSIKKFLESPPQSFSPENHPFESLSANYSETDSLSQNNDLFLNKESSNLEMRERLSNVVEQRPGRHSGQDSEGVQTFAKIIKRNTSFKTGDDPSRLYVKKTIVVGNVSKYIPPDKREENDQSTHKWMVYVRGSQNEPSIHHFVKKVWFFLHPSYKPNDLVEVSEPPFHLTRRGWGEFPVRVQIHFKDSQNKRVDIIHNLKLDRTYTGLQTLGAETVVDVELHRHSFGEDSPESVYSNASVPLDVSSPIKASSTIKQWHKPITSVPVTKGFFIRSREEQPTTTFHSLQSVLEHSPTKTAPPKIKFGSHGNSAFQPITASCKIIPQSQIPSASESPVKSFQPITMSCKIVSGSPTSKHLGVALAGRGSGSPGPKIHVSSFLTSSVKQEDSLFATMPPLGPIGSHTKLQSAKSVTEGLGTFTKVLIKQESGEPHYQSLVTSTSSQPALQQYVTVKGSHVISVSPQKPLVNASEVSSTPNKVVGVPFSSAVQPSMKPAMAISGGQILVAKSVSSFGKVTGQKPVVAQGVAKALVSSGGGGSTIVAQPVQTITKVPALSSGAQKAAAQGSVMATLQLPATNLSNLANLPPGTKLYLTTNSKNPSGKGKLLLIPQGALLRATNNASVQCSSSGSTAGGTQSTNSGLSQHLSYTSYILKQTPQGTFLVGQSSAQSSAKQGTQNAVVQGGMGPGTSTTPAQSSLKVVSGQKTAILAQGAGGQTALTKLSESSLTSTVAPQVLSRGGTTMLRLTGGVITAATSMASNGFAPQQVDAAHSSSSSAVTSALKASGEHHPIIVNQVQSGASATSNPCMATAVRASSFISAAPIVSGRTSTPGLLKIQSNLSSPQKNVLTIPTSQMKQLGGTTATAGVQTMLIPVNKVLHTGSTCKLPAAPTESPVCTLVPHSALATVTKVKTEPEMTVPSNSNTSFGSLNSTIVKTEEITDLKNYCISIEYLDNSQQLLTTVVKKIPLLTEKSEDAEPFCAKSVEQYYSWNIGKRRAAEWQRAVRVRKILLEIAEKNPKFSSVCLLTTKHVMYWCRHHGYTPPDLESLRDKVESIEDVLTQIDSEPECPSSYSTAESLCRKLEDLQQILKKEPERDEEVDIVNVTNPLKANIKKEQKEKVEEVKFYLEPTLAIDFVSNTAQKIGVSFQPFEVEKNVYACAVEDMIVKATEQLVSDILREALAVGYQTVSYNRSPKEISMMNIHRAICNIPSLDFLSNKYMGVLNMEQ